MKKLRAYTLGLFAIVLFPMIYALDDKDEPFIEKYMTIKTYECPINEVYKLGYTPYCELRFNSITGIYEGFTEIFQGHYWGKYEIAADTLILYCPECSVDCDSIKFHFKKQTNPPTVLRRFLIKSDSLISIPNGYNIYTLQHEKKIIYYDLKDGYEYIYDEILKSRTSR